MNRRVSVNVFSIFLVFCVLAAPLIYTHVFTLRVFASLILAVFGCGLFGEVLLLRVQLNKNLLPLTRTAISVFAGALVFSMFVFITPAPLVLISSLTGLTLYILLVLWKDIEWSVKPQTPDIVAFVVIVAVIALISGEELVSQFRLPPYGTDCYSPDHYFFTSIVTTLRHGSIMNAAYEVNTPVNYQLLGFFIPALWADLLGISSHQALWGLALPFYKLLAILLPYEVCYYFLKDKVTRRNFGFIVVAILLPILMAPLHPLYVLKGDVPKFIFNGCGYLLPAGTITYPIASFFLSYCMLLFAGIDWKEKKISADKIVFTIALGIMVIGKVPLFFGLAVFIGTIVLKRVIFDREKIGNYIGYALGFIVVAFVAFKLCMGMASGARTFFKYGYLAELFSGWYHSAHFNTLVIILLIIFTYLLWLGIRLLGLTSLVRSGNVLMKEYFWGGVMALVVTTVLASFMRINTVDAGGVVTADTTFDVQQFIRSGFYVLTMASVVGLAYLLYSGLLKRKLVTILAVVVFVWGGLSASAIVAFTYFRSAPCVDDMAWYVENYNLLKSGKLNDGLIAVNPYVASYGVMLASSDAGIFWTAMGRSEGNYNSSNIHAYRWQLFKSMLDSTDEKHFVQMKSEGVKYIISTPYDSARIKRASAMYPQHLQRMSGTGWVYKVE